MTGTIGLWRGCWVCSIKADVTVVFTSCDKTDSVSIEANLASHTVLVPSFSSSEVDGEVRGLTSIRTVSVSSMNPQHLASGVPYHRLAAPIPIFSQVILLALM